MLLVSKDEAKQDTIDFKQQMCMKEVAGNAAGDAW